MEPLVYRYPDAELSMTDAEIVAKCREFFEERVVLSRSGADDGRLRWLKRQTETLWRKRPDLWMKAGFGHDGR